MRRRVLAHSWTSAIRCGPDSDRPSTEALRRVSGLRSDLGANDFGQAQRAGARVVAVGEHQVEFAPALAALAQGQLFEYAARAGGERWGELSLVFADRDYAGPGA